MIDDADSEILLVYLVNRDNNTSSSVNTNEKNHNVGNNNNNTEDKNDLSTSRENSNSWKTD